MTEAISVVTWLTALRRYVAISAGLHLAWEIAHLPLYTLWRTGTAREIAFAILHCTAGDLMIGTLSLVATLLVLGKPGWPGQRFGEVAVSVLVLGLAYTIYSEWLNTVVRKSWTYAEMMPTLPFLGTGLSPLAQWLVIPVVAMLAVRGSLGIRPLGTR